MGQAKVTISHQNPNFGQCINMVFVWSAGSDLMVVWVLLQLLDGFIK